MERRKAPNLSHELIIGTDVMKKEEFIIDYINNVVKIGEIMIPILNNEAKSKANHIYALKTFEIEPLSEKVIWRKVPEEKTVEEFLIEKSGRHTIVKFIVKRNAEGKCPS